MEDAKTVASTVVVTVVAAYAIHGLYNFAAKTVKDARAKKALKKI